MHISILFLRVLHILTAIFWGGAVLFFVFFLEPSLRAAGPGAAPVLLALGARRFFNILPAIAGTTILSGAVMFWIDSNGFSGTWMGSAPGIAYSIGGTFGTLALLVGGSVVGPAGKTLIALIREAAAAPEGPARQAIAGAMEPLRERLRLGAAFAATFLLVAATSMAVARYL